MYDYYLILPNIYDIILFLLLNSVQCIGQTIDLPKGSRVLHILAAADIDTEVLFKSGEKEFPLTIGGWTGYMGSWDNREFEGFVAELSYSLRNNLKTIHPAFIRNQRLHGQPHTIICLQEMHCINTAICLPID